MALFGTTGEGPCFSVGERQATLTTLIDAGIDPGRLIVGVGCTALPDAVSLAQHATALNCRTLLFTPPFYFKDVGDEGLFDAFAELLDATADSRGQVITPFVQGHGPEDTLGYRIGDVAYSTDVVSLDDAAFAALEGLELWVVDCLRERPHPTHSHLAQTLEWIARARPKRAVLTHMNHEADYAAIAALCPPGVEPGYDGLVVEVAG